MSSGDFGRLPHHPLDKWVMLSGKNRFSTGWMSNATTTSTPLGSVCLGSLLRLLDSFCLCPCSSSSSSASSSTSSLQRSPACAHAHWGIDERVQVCSDHRPPLVASSTCHKHSPHTQKKNCWKCWKSHHYEKPISNPSENIKLLCKLTLKSTILGYAVNEYVNQAYFLNFFIFQ